MHIQVWQRRQHRTGDSACVWVSEHEQYASKVLALVKLRWYIALNYTLHCMCVYLFNASDTFLFK